MGGLPWDVSVGGEGLACRKEGRPLFRTDGPAVIRRYREERGGTILFDISALRPIDMHWRAFPVSSAELDGKAVDVDEEVPFHLHFPAGTHSVRLVPVAGK
jgi:hypothetical protein